jgi:hypothetical protein
MTFQVHGVPDVCLQSVQWHKAYMASNVEHILKTTDEGFHTWPSILLAFAIVIVVPPQRHLASMVILSEAESDIDLDETRDWLWL